MYSKDIINIFRNILAWYHLILIVASVTLNPIVVYICAKSRKLRSTTTFKLLAASAINDIVCCLGWNQAQFSNTVLNFNSSQRSIIYCRLVTYFLQYTSIQYESWMLFSISLDRFLSMWTKKWSKDYFHGFRPYAFALTLAFLIICVNFVEIFTVGYIYYKNETEIIVCNTSAPGGFPWNRIMAWVKLN